MWCVGRGFLCIVGGGIWVLSFVGGGGGGSEVGGGRGLYLGFCSGGCGVVCDGGCWFFVRCRGGCNVFIIFNRGGVWVVRYLVLIFW